MFFFRNKNIPENIPHKNLWKSFVKNENIQSYLNKPSIQFKPISLQILEGLARQSLFNFEAHHYQVLLYKNGARQVVEACTSQAVDLIQHMKTSAYQKEHLQIVLQGHQSKAVSQIISGSQNKVATFKQIVNLLLEMRLDMEKSGDQIKRANILHTHPSLELIGHQKNKTFLCLHPLSRTDIFTLEKLQQHFLFPIALSAITPSGIQYTCRSQDILCC